MCLHGSMHATLDMDWSSDASCSPNSVDDKLRIDLESESEAPRLLAGQPTTAARRGLPVGMPGCTTSRTSPSVDHAGASLRPHTDRPAGHYPEYETSKSSSGASMDSIRMSLGAMATPDGQTVYVKREPAAERPDRDTTNPKSRGRIAVDNDLENPARRMRRRELSQLSQEEAERVVRRRERNKVAATKCRHKRREQHENLVKELQDMECENTSLTYEIRQLQRQRQALSDALRHHQMGCTQRHLMATSSTTVLPMQSEPTADSFTSPYPLYYTT